MTETRATQYRHHPVTSSFPMMKEEEMQGLVEDIKKHGLVQPIVLDSEGAVVDGRCRLLACEIAGVEPRFRKLEEGTDVEAYFVSANIARADYTPGQRAMWCAQIERLCPDQKPITAVPALRALVDWAHFVIEHAPDLVPGVMNRMGIAEAYKEACKRRDDLAADLAARQRKLNTLREGWRSTHLGGRY
jgi:ParB-like nuclease domain